MGLKCSVLGHAYGETTVERDREERGSEVVITIRELETCDRCGDTRIVTENKEVTTVETTDDRPDVTAADAVEAMESESASDDGGEPLVDDAEGGAAVERDGTVESPNAGGADDAAGVSSPSPDAVTDEGAEILDAEGRDAENDDPVDDELADPTIETDADVPGESNDDEEDAVILEDGPANEDSSAEGSATAAEQADGSTGAKPFETPDSADDEEENPLDEWPEETLRDDADWTPSENLTGTVDDIDPEANVRSNLSTNSAVTVPDGEFHCSECSYTTSVEASSLRAGDFCPECRSGTLVHRAEE